MHGQRTIFEPFTYLTLPLRMSGVQRCSRTYTSDINAAKKATALCAVVLMNSVLAGSTAAPMWVSEPREPLPFLADGFSAIQTEVMVRSALTPAGSDVAGSSERAPAEHGRGLSAVCLLNTLILLLAAHGLKHWGQPAAECRSGPLTKEACALPSQLELQRQEEEEQAAKEPSSAAADVPDGPACDNHNDAGAWADGARFRSSVREGGTDVGAFLIAWDCFQ
mmetsp:Transcript_27184/g.84583  ORF Transcript_27184/g.84583 Transcript_27184/m.84583 type:complete len:222 (+) Transcript_27184:56-721(+)